MGKIPKRSEVNVENTWRLEDIFETKEDWEKEYEALNRIAPDISGYAGKLGESAENLLAYFKCMDDIEIRLGKLYGYASCHSDEDTKNSFYMDMHGKAEATCVGLMAAGAFARSEIMAIPEETLAAFYNECKELEVYRRSIYQIRRKAAHILSPKEEKLLSAAGEMAGTASRIAGILRNADFKFDEVKDAEGNTYPLTNGTFVSLLENTDQEFRKQVFETYYRQYSDYQNTIASTLDGQFKQLNFYAKAKNYKSTLEASLDETEVPVEVYKKLIDSVHNNLSPMYEYVKLRKKMLSVPELHIYDVYTPIVKDAASKITFEEAKKTVLEALSVLGNDYTDILKEGFNNRWIDVYENEGKRSGAYSSGAARPHPYVLLNHKDNLDSMFTLAHEMGHALHSYHSIKYQPVSTSDYVIFVAEVASTCNEVLLMKYLLKKTEDKSERMYLINHFLDSFKGTVYRQTMFAEFEMWMGEQSENGRTLTADMLNEKYLELNKLYFGPDMICDDFIKLEWARIPHFFYNYYVFQYATGFSAAVAIANRILNEGEAAVKDYKKFLSSGSSNDPISLLKIAGVDMASPEPVNSALKLFSELVEELKKENE